MKKTIIIPVILALLMVVALSINAARKPRNSGIDAPSNLSATAISSSQINLSWQDNTRNEDGFKIERSLNGQDFSEIDEVSEGVTTYPNTGLSADTRYYYRVRAYRQQGQKIIYSGYSNTANDMTYVDTVPDDPSNLDASTSTSTDIYLSWQDNSDNEDGFSVERGTDGENFGEIDTVPADFIYYTDSNTTSSVTYYYQVRAFNEAGYSEYSNVASTTAP